MDDENPSFFSVYLHFVAGGVMCCADLPAHPDALHCAHVIARRHRWPIYDFCLTTRTHSSNKHVEHEPQATGR
ncbi:hypothetical protein [Burkholderia gladioli]|uniref:hypothetical protein n=1 Tax=Burkholderia gladioli TaxID=28095 RepID=UPI0034DB5638